MNIKQHKYKLFLEKLRENNGNRTQTAKDLGISIRTARNWVSDLRDMGKNVPDPQHKCNPIGESAAWERRA